MGYATIGSSGDRPSVRGQESNSGIRQKERESRLEHEIHIPTYSGVRFKRRRWRWKALLLSFHLGPVVHINSWNERDQQRWSFGLSKRWTFNPTKQWRILNNRNHHWIPSVEEFRVRCFVNFLTMVNEDGPTSNVDPRGKISFSDSTF